MNIFRWICYFDNKLFVLVALLCLFIVETCYRYPRGQKEVEDRRNPPVKEFVITKKDDPEEVTSSELMESSYSGKTSFEFSQLVFGEIFVFGTTPSEASTEPMTPSESPTSPDSEEISPVPSPGPWVVSRIQNRVIVYSYVLCGRRCDQLGIENITSSCISAHSITKKLVREVCCPNYNPSEKLIIQKLFITIWQIVYDLFYESYEPSAASEPIKKLPEGKRAQSADDQTQEIVTDENRKGQRAQEPSGTFDIAHAFGILQVTLPNHCSYVTVEESQESADKGSLTAASKPHNSAAPQPKIGFKMALDLTPSCKLEHQIGQQLRFRTDS